MLTTKWGAFAGLLGGILMAVVWRFTPALVEIVAYEALPAFLFSAGVTVVVSLLTRPTKDEKLLDDLRPPSTAEMEAELP